MKTLTSLVLTKFPRNRIAFCSAFVPNATQPVEILFCVNDLYKWHAENISMNPSHYSFMRFCGSTLLTQLHMRGGAGVYCHPRAQLANGQIIQYETISEGDFCYDLNHWSELHVSGHLHKPIEIIVAASSDEVAISIENNIKNVLRITLLLLPEEFSYEDLFVEIALCAYDGKYVRTTLAKNREKIRQMTETKLQEYFRYYLPYLKQHFSHCVQLPDPNELSDGKIKQDKSMEMIRKHFLGIPSYILISMGELLGKENLSEEETFDLYKDNHEILVSKLKVALIQTVGQTHRGQELKKFITAVLPNAMMRI